jgi:hypothetical protein
MASRSDSSQVWHLGSRGAVCLAGPDLREPAPPLAPPTNGRIGVARLCGVACAVPCDRSRRGSDRFLRGEGGLSQYIWDEVSFSVAPV